MSQETPRQAGAANVVDEFGVDYTRPVLPQLDELGDRYWDWVHVNLRPSVRERLAVVQPDAAFPGSFPVFANPWLEANTHISWRLVLSLWVPTTVLMLGMARWREMGWFEMGGAFAAGFLLWTLVEYLLHRVVFHHRPRGSWQRKLHFLAHGIHHKDPWDPSRLVFPPLAGYAIALVLFVLIHLAIPLPSALATMAGLLVGYLAYDLGHFAWHHARCAHGIAHYLKRYHLAHHHRDSDSHYGVSLPLWDVVFRTYSSRH